MEKYREYLSHARECEQLAKNMKDPVAREQWEKLAATWRSLAGERQQMFHLTPEPENGDGSL